MWSFGVAAVWITSQICCCSEHANVTAMALDGRKKSGIMCVANISQMRMVHIKALRWNSPIGSVWFWNLGSSQPWFTHQLRTSEKLMQHSKLRMPFSLRMLDQCRCHFKVSFWGLGWIPIDVPRCTDWFQWCHGWNCQWPGPWILRNAWWWGGLTNHNVSWVAQCFLKTNQHSWFAHSAGALKAASVTLKWVAQWFY